MTIDDINKLCAEDCPKFSNFARDKLPLPGRKRRLDEILNKNILVTDYRLNKSKKHVGAECLQLQFLVDNEVCIAFTGSVVLINQIESVKENIPFTATIVKIDKYYSFS